MKISFEAGLHSVEFCIINNFCKTVAGAAPYGVFPNQPQLYAAQGPPPPTYDQTLTHPMVRLLILLFT